MSVATLSLLRDDVERLVKDDAGRLTIPEDYDIGIRFALSHYSQHRPLQTAIILPVSASYEIALSNVIDFDEGFSDLLTPEWPVSFGGDNPNYLDPNDWTILTDDTGDRVIRFLSSGNSLTGGLPSVGDPVKLHYSKRHVIPSSETGTFTVRDSDMEAVACLAASWCLQQMANLYTQLSQKATLMADITNYDRKTEDCAARADTLRTLFDQHLESSSIREVRTGTVELIRS